MALYLSLTFFLYSSYSSTLFFYISFVVLVQEETGASGGRTGTKYFSHQRDPTVFYIFSDFCFPVGTGKGGNTRNPLGRTVVLG